MSFVQRTVAHCDQCGHEWIITKPDFMPPHCAKCKSRQWNAGEKKSPPMPVQCRHCSGTGEACYSSTNYGKCPICHGRGDI